jgi:1-acyl-sn-glycerol-3-phosphate acyltransferase
MFKEKLTVAWYWFARWACRFFCIIWFRVRIYGRENVPDKGPFILASNHQSYLDPLFCGVGIKRHLTFLARDTLFRNNFFGLLIYSLNAIPVKRDQADISSIREVITRLKQGGGVCLFPEATRTINGKISNCKPGLGLLCRRSNAVVIPVLIDGAFQCWPRHKRIFSPGTVAVFLGRAIAPQKVQSMDDRKLAQTLTKTLRQMQNQHRIKQGKQPYSYSI